MPYRFSQTAEELQGFADVAEDNIALEYDASLSYAVGSYCTREGGLYRCTSAATGTWDASKWTEITVMGEIASLNSNLTNINVVTDTNDAAASVSVPSDIAAWKQLASVTPGAGTYLIIGYASFAQNANGLRGLSISTLASPSGLFSRTITLVNATSASNTIINTIRVMTVSASDSVRLFGRQNSGSALTAYPRLTLIRLR